jgi:hypothetical protein
MSDFENKLASAAQKAVLDHVSSGHWLEPNYAARLRVPPEMLADVWNMVDIESIKRKLADRLESELADRMVNHMAAELATDIKQILSVKERREMLRGLARQHMDAVMRAGSAS